MPALGPIHFITRSNRHLPRVPAGSRQFRHPHHILALHRIEGGQAGLGDEYQPVAGAFLALLPAGDRDVNDMHGRDDAWWCAFDGDGVCSVTGGAQLGWSGMTCVLPRCHSLKGVQNRQAETLFHELQVALAADGVAGRLTAQARLEELLALWVATGTPPTDDWTERFRALLEEHACRADCSLEDLARRLGRHPDVVSAAFRRRYGCTPVLFRTRLRLQLARELLIDGQTPAAVAAVCGFADPGYFGRVFRRHVGLTPGQWSQRFGTAAAG